MKKKLLLVTFLILAIIGVLAGIKVSQFRAMIHAAQTTTPPPEAVSTVVVRPEHWQGTLSAIGSVCAVQGVTLTPEIAGTLRQIAFESGASITQGDLLVKLDTSSEEAQLRAIEAQVELARINAERMRTLRAQKTIAQADLDAAEATLKEDQGNADNIQATIAKKTLRAPFSGQLGIRLVNLGQYLDTGTPIVSLQALSPIYVNFSLPQQELARLKKGMHVRVGVDTYPGRQFDGELTALNPDLDSNTRMVALQARFENAEQLLRPGMFARVEVLLPEEHDVLAVPQTAILSDPYGDSVYVVEAASSQTNSTATNGLVLRHQFVRVGEARGDFVNVQTGLKPGEKVVSAGVFRLRPGMNVFETNAVVPPTSLTPRPSDS